MRVRVSRHCVVFWRVRRAHFDYPLYLPRYGCILYISHTKLCTFAIFKVRKNAAVRMTVRHVVFDFWPWNVKDKDEPSDRRGAVYKIKCCDCQATYIGETGRNLNVPLTEHKRATRNGDINNHIAEHHLKTNHRIDWDSAECVTYSTDYYQRITLESWFTNLPTATCTLQTTDCRQ